MPTRCWNGASCRKPHCTYIHPDHKSWDIAVASDRSSRPSPRDKKNDRNASTSKLPWPSPVNTTGWDTPDNKKDESSWGKGPTSTNPWGASNDDSWNTTEGWASGSGWGVQNDNNDNKNQWGSAWGNGYDKGKQKEADTSNAQAKDAKDNNKSPAGDTEQRAGGWGYDSDKGKEKEKDNNDTGGKDAHSWGSGWGDENGNGHLGKEDKRDQPLESREIVQISSPPSGFALPTPLTQRKSDLPRLYTDLRLPSYSGPKSSYSYKSHRSIFLTREEIPAANSLGQAVRRFMEDKAEGKMGGSSSPIEYLGPKGRVALFADTLLHTLECVIAQLDLIRAAADLQAWKKLKKSREGLLEDALKTYDSYQTNYQENVNNAVKKRDKALADFLSLPALTSHLLVLDPHSMKEKVINYTAELRDWYSEMQLHTRIGAEPSTEVELDAVDTPASNIPCARQLVDRGNWTWEEFKYATESLEKKVNEVTENIYAILFTKSDGPDLEIPPYDNSSPSAIEVSHDGNFGEMRENLDYVDRGIVQEALSAGNMLSNELEIKTQLDQITLDIAAMDDICFQAEESFKQFEKENEEDERMIQLLSQKIEAINLLRESSSAGALRTWAALENDVLTERVTRAVFQRLEPQISTYLENLYDRVLEDRDHVRNELDILLSRPLRETNYIRQRVKEHSLQAI